MLVIPNSGVASGEWCSENKHSNNEPNLIFPKCYGACDVHQSCFLIPISFPCFCDLLFFYLFSFYLFSFCLSDSPSFAQASSLTSVCAHHLLLSLTSFTDHTFLRSNDPFVVAQHLSTLITGLPKSITHCF